MRTAFLWLSATVFLAACAAEGPTFRASLPMTGEMVYELD